MAKAGIWRGYERATAKSGNEYFKCTIEDDGGNDRSYNVFDPGMRETAEKLHVGSSITYAIVKQGQFWNLESLDGTEAQKKTGSAPKAAPAKRDDVNWDELGRQKAECGMMNGAFAGGLIKTPEDVNKWGVVIHRAVQNIITNKYATMEKDGEIPF